VRVTAALLARYAETEPDGGLLNVIGGGTDVFGVPELPVEFSMPFGLQLRFAEADAGTTFQIGMVVRGPDPTSSPPAPPTEFGITPQFGDYHAPGWEGVFYVSGVVALDADEYGRHSISILINGKESATIPYQIVESQQSP
jgi:hypothetical protein